MDSYFIVDISTLMLVYYKLIMICILLYRFFRVFMIDMIMKIGRLILKISSLFSPNISEEMSLCSI